MALCALRWNGILLPTHSPDKTDSGGNFGLDTIQGEGWEVSSSRVGELNNCRPSLRLRPQGEECCPLMGLQDSLNRSRWPMSGPTQNGLRLS
jgi:hypothetical protein